MAERWYEITGYFDPNREEVIEAGDVRVIVRGSIDDVIIVQVPANLPERAAHVIMRQVQATMEGGGVDRPLVLMPDHIKLMKVRKLSAKETAAIKGIHAASSKDEKAVH